MNYVRVCEKTFIAVKYHGTDFLVKYPSYDEAFASRTIGEYCMPVSQYKTMRDTKDIVDNAGITTEEPTFDDFLDKAKEYMTVASNDGYYNAVMLNAPVNEEKIINDNIDDAIRVLKLAKRFAKKVGF